MPSKRRSMQKKAIRTRKLSVVGKKTAKKKRDLKAAGTKAANTTKRRAAAWRAAATKTTGCCRCRRYSGPRRSSASRSRGASYD